MSLYFGNIESSSLDLDDQFLFSQIESLLIHEEFRQHVNVIRNHLIKSLDNSNKRYKRYFIIK